MSEFFNVHAKWIKLKFDENKSKHTARSIGFKLAEYSACSGVPIVDCYKIYIALFGECEFSVKRLKKLTVYYEN